MFHPFFSSILLLKISNNIVFHFTVVFFLKYYDKFLLNKRCFHF
ncbi:243R [Invertebrate iridescent virus Kaz2018]|uniref:243R n=1 Tax=Invertebrate iridescent virus 6 TaxID=176652 RepID=Q91FS9_IIV6|nr:243R [Invertebrate iridescent virus 6]AAK82104.1 243R [Invertebrate iridescent virus 6]QMS79699.1 hypothetical protein IIV6-T1_238 [Invertebrate iridescent virus 6]QNH08653.1 243R [Invertebrate iridescent virus Kaz2018]